ncbi:MAG: energy transducer TonB [Bacteroidota bacterium]|jgi:TonB family protein
MKYLLVFAAGILISLSSSTLASERPKNDPARPEIGWEAFKSMIPYPEIAKRAGVQGYSNASVKLDTAGAVLSVSISGYGIFDKPIEEAVKKVQWLPELDNGKPRETTVIFEVQFQLKSLQDMPKKKILIIESDR